MAFEIKPSSIQELIDVMDDAGARKRRIQLGGQFSKRVMGGEIGASDVVLSTRELNRIIEYEPKDLTISVEAGLPFQALADTLAAQGQMLPLDPPFSGQATVGGMIATNSSGPRRRRYGTARDMVIGMSMVTIGGKLVESGGMVVKNVTGLDIAKLMIGSYGTLAAIGSVNFKVFPRPEVERSFLFGAADPSRILTLRRDLVESVLQPVAMDILNSEATHRIGVEMPAKYVMIVMVAGNATAAARYEREYQKIAAARKVEEFLPIPASQAPVLWKAVQNMSYSLLSAEPKMAILRVSSTATRLGEVFRLASDIGHETPVLTRGGAAVSYLYCSNVTAAKDGLRMAVDAKLPAVIEAAPVGEKTMLEQWHKPQNGIDVMRRLKHRFDPDYLLNRGRLFNQI